MPAHMQRQIDHVKNMILALAANVEQSVHKAIDAVRNRDVRLAQEVIDHDAVIDQAEIDVEEECLHTLALYQPFAFDLRFIVAVLKINNDLERIGDMAVNIAERAVFLCTQERLDVPFRLREMAEKAQAMLKKSLDALVNLDTHLALAVCAADDEVDALYVEMYERVREGILSQQENVDSLLNILSVSRYLERIADHATNIAEDVIYMIEGEIVRHGAKDFKPPSGGKNQSSV